MDVVLYSRRNCHLCDVAKQVLHDAGITPEFSVYAERSEASPVQSRASLRHARSLRFAALSVGIN